MFISINVPLRFNKTDVKCILRRSEAWISNTIDWEYSSNLSLMSISSYVVHSTKETGNMHPKKWHASKCGWIFILRPLERFIHYF